MKSEVSNSVQMMSSPNTFSVNKDRLSKLNRVLKDSFYKDIIENSASYNTRLCLERKMRLPFLDAQTGVAQSDCALWIPKWQRMPGNNHGQIYTYPAKRWHKKRRQYLMNNRYLTGYGKESEMLETSKNVFKEQTPLPSPEVHQMNVVDNTVRIDQEDSIDKMAEDSKDSWFKDIENAVDPSDIGQIDDGDLDYVDYEETYKKKKRKVKNNRSKRKSEKNESHEEKPYSCDVCGIRYKTRPGLNYHYAHSHNDESVDTAEEDANLTPPLKISRPSSSGHSSMGTASDGSLAGLRKFQDSFTTFLKASSNESKPEPAKSVSPSPYCDFCLGDSIENKKTNLAEELVSCSDCGRSAHPTCLQFTPNMTVSVKKYFWQCIECKSCGLCGTSDNDAQLLFCDDCDRGYHMYCLTPPLQEPPEGLWSCHLCIEEYHKK